MQKTGTDDEKEIATQNQSELMTIDSVPPSAAPVLARRMLADRDNSIAVTKASYIKTLAKEADVNDINSMRNCVTKFLQFCYDTKTLPSYGQMCHACGLTHATLRDWAYGVTRKNEPEYMKFAQDIISYANDIGDESVQKGTRPVLWELSTRNTFQGAQQEARNGVPMPNTEKKSVEDPEEIYKKYGIALIDDESSKTIDDLEVKDDESM